MPFYTYEVILEDGEPGQVFEVFQQMSDEPLTEHPQTGQPVRRLLSTPNIATKYTEFTSKKNLADDKKLDQMGFTKYVKAGNGEYEKRAGQGPDTLSAKD
ncbi:MAG: FmdB family zinc ribbon protein [Planctomycetota bacterium]|jgi:predicted nucleic acid-binding Zn ribbon protein